jgi:hypothetical protein
MSNYLAYMKRSLFLLAESKVLGQHEDSLHGLFDKLVMVGHVDTVSDDSCILGWQLPQAELSPPGKVLLRWLFISMLLELQVLNHAAHELAFILFGTTGEYEVVILQTHSPAQQPVATDQSHRAACPRLGWAFMLQISRQLFLTSQSSMPPVLVQPLENDTLLEHCTRSWKVCKGVITAAAGAVESLLQPHHLTKWCSCPVLLLSETNNEVHTEIAEQGDPDQYKHISVLQHLACGDLQLLSKINSLKCKRQLSVICPEHNLLQQCMRWCALQVRAQRRPTSSAALLPCRMDCS